MACPREGDPAPDFGVGGGRNLSSLAPAVVYFFPRAFTAGCTRELERFVQLLGDFESLGATIVGVSADGPGTMERFGARHGARPPLILVPDPEGRVIGAYCAGSGRGKGARRVTFVVGPDGRIAAVLEGLRRAEEHADRALEVLRSLVRR
ncbi:MAG: peroxiredoxin [Conexivisphaera sp.]